MFKLAVVGTVAALATATKVHPINEDIVKEIKAKATTWTAHEVSENPLRHRSHDELLTLLGTHPETAVSNAFNTPPVIETPKNFDSRDQWGDCVHPVRDQ
jgi:hypothetical protein